MTPREIADAILSGDMKGPHHEAYGKALSRALIKVHGERDAAVKRAEEAQQKLAAAQDRIAYIETHGYVLAGETLDAVADVLGIPKDGVISGETAKAALVRAREEMRDAAVAAARAAWGNDGLPRSVTDAIAALPTTGGKP